MTNFSSRGIGRPGPTERWERRYREALDAAATAFADRGYLGASTQDIADRLGIKQGSLYYYFTSKDAALSAICELGVRSFIDQLRDILAQAMPADDKLRAAIANHLLPLRAQPEADYIRVFLRHRHELPDGACQRVAALARTYQSLIEKLFADGQASGEFRASLNPKLATLGLLGLCNSVIGRRALPRGSSINNIIEEYAGIFTHGVGAA